MFSPHFHLRTRAENGKAASSQDEITEGQLRRGFYYPDRKVNESQQPPSPAQKRILTPREMWDQAAKLGRLAAYSDPELHMGGVS